MNTILRIKTIRLIEKINKYPEIAKSMGIGGTNKKRKGDGKYEKVCSN